MHCCPESESSSPDVSAPAAGLGSTSWLWRIASFLQWVTPITALAFVPKCPGCVAGYVLLLTGVGVSIATATAVRWLVIAFSVATLAFLVLGAARRFFGLGARAV